MKEIWNWIQLGAVTVGGALGWFVGGFDGLVYTLVAFVAADYITGVLRAVAERKLSSRIGAQGIVKKLAIFLVVGIANVVDAQLLGGASALRTAVLFFYISNEGISMLENAGAIIPIPAVLRNVLAQLNGKNIPQTGEPSEPGGEYIIPPHPTPENPKQNNNGGNDDENLS